MINTTTITIDLAKDVFQAAVSIRNLVYGELNH
jgi:hypothetical protein